MGNVLLKQETNIVASPPVSNEQYDLSRPRYLPGDPNGDTHAMLRVDHAGEYGAVRIYQGQLDGLRKSALPETITCIEEMKQQEERHLEYFNQKLQLFHARPTAMMGVWHWAGYMMGFICARFSHQHAMACTVAVEDEIDIHYKNQLYAINQHQDDLYQTIARFRAEELEHAAQADTFGGTKAFAFPVLYKAIRKTSRLAIWLSERF